MSFENIVLKISQNTIAQEDPPASQSNYDKIKGKADQWATDIGETDTFDDATKPVAEGLNLGALLVWGPIMAIAIGWIGIKAGLITKDQGFKAAGNHFVALVILILICVVAFAVLI